MPFCRRVSSLVVIALGAAAAVSAGGCYFPGGPGYSADRFTYESTSWEPVTLSLVDTRTSQTVWSVDVPVGKELVVAFREDEGTKDGAMPDLMKWDILPMGQRFGELHNSIAVPPKDSRRLDPTYRPSPELPDSMSAQQAPPRQPAVTPSSSGQQPPAR